MIKSNELSVKMKINVLSVGKYIKFILVWMISMCLISSMNDIVYAKTKIDSIISETEIEGQTFLVYTHQNSKVDFTPTAEDSQAFFGSQPCSVLNIEKVDVVPQGITYDCIIDVSGSMDQKRIEKAKEMLCKLVADKKDTDVFRITCMGNERKSSEFMTSSDEIIECISRIELTNEDTNLYDSIKEELLSLQENQSLPERKCLIIFSDGADDHASGITREEAQKAIEESSIPVFTIAMLNEKYTDAQLEATKILGSFGRASFGGEHFVPQIDEWEYEEAIEQIEAICNESLLVTIDLSDLKLQNTTYDMTLYLSDKEKDSTVYYEIDSDLAMELLLSEPQENLTLNEVNDKNVDLASKADDENENSMTQVSANQIDKLSLRKDGFDQLSKWKEEIGSTQILIGAIVIVFFVWLFLFIIILLNKSKRKNHSTKESREIPPYIDIVLHRQNDHAEIKERLKDELSLGRGNMCDIIISDDALSEIHCILLYRKGNVYIVDQDSTNGTYVNGIPQKGSYEIASGDVLLLGSYEYVVLWE